MNPIAGMATTSISLFLLGLLSELLHNPRNQSMLGFWWLLSLISGALAIVMIVCRNM